MKYRIAKSRVDETIEGKYFHVTEDENTIEGNIFYGSWTDNPEEYQNDESIDILVAEVITHPVQYREKVNFNFSPFGGPRLPVRVPSEMH